MRFTRSESCSIWVMSSPRIRVATSCEEAGLRRPKSSISISGWSMWLMRIRLAMNSHRRWKVWEVFGILALRGLGSPLTGGQHDQQSGGLQLEQTVWG